MKRIALIAIGIPGSGKTTTLAPLVARYGMLHINRDDIRHEWFGHPHVQALKEAVWLEAERRMREALAAGHHVLLDSTFTESAKRTRIIEAAREAGAERVLGLQFTTPLTEAKRRNNEREYSVSEDVIDMMYAQLTAKPPQLDEGFDALYTDKEMAKLEAELSSLN